MRAVENEKAGRSDKVGRFRVEGECANAIPGGERVRVCMGRRLGPEVADGRARSWVRYDSSEHHRDRENLLEADARESAIAVTVKALP